MEVGCLIYFSSSLQSDMSKYGYLEVFQSPLDFEITRVDWSKNLTTIYRNMANMYKSALIAISYKYYAFFNTIILCNSTKTSFGSHTLYMYMKMEFGSKLQEGHVCCLSLCLLFLLVSLVDLVLWLWHFLDIYFTLICISKGHVSILECFKDTLYHGQSFLNFKNLTNIYLVQYLCNLLIYLHAERN